MDKKLSTKEDEAAIKELRPLLKSTKPLKFDDVEAETLPPMNGKATETPPPKAGENENEQAKKEQQEPPPGPEPDPAQEAEMFLEMVVDFLDDGTQKMFKKSNIPPDQLPFSHKEKDNWKKAIGQAAPAFLQTVMNSKYGPLALCIIGTYGTRFRLAKVYETKKDENDGNESKN